MTNGIYKVVYSCYSKAALHPGTVFTLLLRLIRPLNSHLLQNKVPNLDSSLMSVVGDLCGTESMELIIKQCLMPSVPSNQNDLEK